MRDRQATAILDGHPDGQVDKVICRGCVAPKNIDSNMDLFDKDKIKGYAVA